MLLDEFLVVKLILWDVYVTLSMRATALMRND